jgi:hypothetical protein
MPNLAELQKRIEAIETLLSVVNEPKQPYAYFDHHELSIAIKAIHLGNAKPLDTYKRKGGIIKMI